MNEIQALTRSIEKKGFKISITFEFSTPKITHSILMIERENKILMHKKDHLKFNDSNEAIRKFNKLNHSNDYLSDFLIDFLLNKNKQLGELLSIEESKFKRNRN